MKMFVTGAVLLVGLALAAPASAAPGQCSLSGIGEFSCDVSVDGGGITFSLPDGRLFVFAHVSNGEGLAYIGSGEPSPGQYPSELGAFVPAQDRAGCWMQEDGEMTFCAALLQ
ncbi:hypothetical protein [Devosia chinhatensis]|uniref:C-type lysozyme inhibitor domain-containing protein n=1 Tax=Devosia chinhatensis TaxID=429727 RepID=A0A0F5FMJ2_9HYPH|nr:hypothetical protein [Devosia chinhatensis]KKB10018.1 hypothetical protein VE26_09505 [Devosia chinhatensis]